MLHCTVSLLHTFESGLGWSSWTVGVHGVIIYFQGVYLLCKILRCCDSGGTCPVSCFWRGRPRHADAAERDIPARGATARGVASATGD